MKNNNRIFSLAGLFFFISFAGGLVAKIIYQINGKPIWLDSVVVIAFGGVFFCSWGVIGIIASQRQWKHANRFDKRIGSVLLFFFYGLIPLVLGVVTLGISVKNLILL